MKLIFSLTLILFSVKLVAQNNRLNDYNNTNWLQLTGTINIDKKWSLHTEYQWRRIQGLKHWQQSLVRIGVNRKLNENITVQLGYGWVETFSYGDYPLANNGSFPEHRIYEQISFKQSIKKWIFTHRFRIEQRWLGRVKAGTDRKIEAWVFLHRFRYQFKTQYSITPKFYIAAADEIFIGAGKKLGVNIFDQNRLLVGVGFKMNKKMNIELSYINQILQQGRLVNNNTIMQRNNGLTLAAIVNL